MWYRLYVDSVGGGTEVDGPREFKDEKDALEYAHDLAAEDYESFEGSHGIVDCGDIMDNPEEYEIEEGDRDAAYEVYEGIKEYALSYWVVEANGPDDIDEDYQ